MHGSKAFPVAAVLSFGTFSSALAAPTGGVVVSGQATISTPSSTATVIDQSSSHVQLNWNSFNVGASESVRFNQPAPTSVALNRILDQNPSQIFGQLQANGRVILVNPNGILFGPTASVNVGSLVASSLDVAGYDPVTGRYRFSTSRADPGAIINQGSITAANGGSVTLLGGRVTNTGAIVADYGTVNLAAGRAATLDFEGDGLLRLTIDSDLVANTAQADSAVANSGTIQANGGQVLLTAQAVQDVYSSLVNNTGLVHAGRIDDTGGVIRLVGAGGTVISSGALDASAADAKSTGGSVSVLGDHVGLFDNAVVNVSGSTGGGTALIGGDFHGADPDVENASRTYVSPGAVINADAGTTGNGGNVVVWSNEVTRYNGSLSARGGTLAGNGGTAEVSGKQSLDFNGRSDLSAAHGSTGDLLLDPHSITIDDSIATEDHPTLSANYAFADDSAVNAVLHASTVKTLLDASNVVLQSSTDITLASGTNITTAATGNSLTLQANRDIFSLGDIINPTGAVTFQAARNIQLGGAISASSVALSAGRNVTGGGAGVAGGALTMQTGSTIGSTGTIALDSASNLTVGSVSSSGLGSLGLVSVVTDGSIVAGSAAQNIVGGSVVLSAGGDIGTVTNFKALSDGSVGTFLSVQTNGALTASSSNAGGDINLILAGTPTLAASAITANNGAIVLQNGGAGLDTTGWSANSINAGSGAGSQIGLRAPGQLGFKATIIGATPQDLLLESGATGFTDGTTAGNLTVGAVQNLDVRTASVGATTLAVNGVNGVLDASVTSGSNLTATVATGGVGIGTVSDTGGGTRAVSITAANGAILDTGAGGITANTLTLSGATLGIAGSSLTTAVSNLAATSTGAGGGVFVSNTGALAIGVAGTGILAGTGGVKINADGAGNAIVINNAVNAGASDVAITTGGGSPQGSITTAGAGVITAGLLTLNASTLGTSGASRLNTQVSAVDATSASGLWIGNSGPLTINQAKGGTGIADISTQNGAITATAASGHGVTLAAGGVGSAINVSGGIDGGTGDVSLTAGNAGNRGPISVGTASPVKGVNLTVVGTSVGSLVSPLHTQVTALLNPVTSAGLYIANAGGALTAVNVQGGAGDVFLDNTGNDISSAGTITGGALTLKGNSLGVTGTHLSTAVSSIDATSTTGVFIDNTGALTDVKAAGGSNLAYVHNVGSITATTVSGTGATLIATGGANAIALNGALNGNAGTVTLTAPGTITEGGSGSVAGGDLQISGSTIGTSAASRFTTAVDSVTATSTGGVFLTDADDLTVTNATGGLGAADIQTTNGNLTVNAASGGGVTLTSAGAGKGIAIGGTINAGALAINLSAGTGGNRGNITGNASNSLQGITLNATGAGIGQNGANTRLNTNAGTLNLTGTGGIFVTDSGAVNLATAQGGAGTVDVRTTNGTLNVGTTVSGASATLAAGGAASNLDLTAGSVNVGAGAATLTAGGSIVDGAGVTSIVAGATTLTGSNLGTAGNPLDTQISGLTATSTVGGVYITQTGGPLSLGAISSATDVTINAGTNAITAGAGNNISGNVLTLTGSTLGGSGGGQRLNTNVASLSATSTAGLFVTEANDLTLTAAAGGTGTADVATTNGVLTVNTTVTGGSASLSSGGANHNLDLTLGSVNVGAGAASLLAGGAITFGAGAITAGDLTLSATSLGTSVNPLTTQASIVHATATAGSVYISQTNSTTVTANATGGDVDVETTAGSLTVGGASGNAVKLVAGGAGSALTINGAVTATGNATLQAPGAIVVGGAGSVTANLLTVSGSVIGSSVNPLVTHVTSLNAASTNGLFVQQSVGPLLVLNAQGGTGAADIGTVNGDLTIDALTGASTNLSTGAVGNAVNLAGPVNVGAGAASLLSGGVLVDTAASGLLTAGTATLGGTSIGTATNAFQVAAATTNATASAGGVFLNTAGGTLTANATGGQVNVTSTGPLNIGSVAGNGVTLATNMDDLTVNGAVDGKGGDVTLHAGTTSGSVAHISGGGTVTANTLNITADSVTGNGVGTALSTHINTLNGAAVNGLAISNIGALVLSSVSGSTVQLATTGAITASGGATINAGALTLNGSAIGATGARLKTNVGSLSATATNGGIFVTDADALQFNGAATGGVVDVKTTNGALSVTGATGTTVTLASGGTGSALNLSGVIDAGSGDVSLTAGTANSGAIAMTSGQIRGNALTATGTSIGASSAPLLTKVATLNATAGNGGVYVSDADDLTLANVSATGDVGITSAAGNLTLDTLSGGGNISLTASSGAISDDGDDTTRISGGALTLLAKSIGGPSTLTGTNLVITPRLDTSVTSLKATSTSGGIYINQSKTLQSAELSASGGASGNIELLLTAGDLNLHSASASNNLLLGAGGNIFALPGLGPITAQHAELRAGTADATAGRIGTLSAPLTFTLAAGDSLRLFVPDTIDPKDPNRGPSTLSSAGTSATITLFTAPSVLASTAGFDQFTGFGETQFTSALESLIKTIQNQTGTVQGVLNIDWGSFDPNVSLFGTLEPAVCLPGDQRDEENAKPGC